MSLEAAFLGSNYLEDEGDEWMPVTRGVVSALVDLGVSVTGEEVRRAIRAMNVETRKVDGRLLARGSDISGLVDLLHGKVKRSVTRQHSEHLDV